MIINVDDLMAKNLSLQYAENPDAFEALADTRDDGSTEFVGSIRFDLNAYRVGELIVVDGVFDAPVRCTCVRCLSEFESRLKADFKLTFTRDETSPIQTPDGAEVELHTDEIGLLPFVGQHIDLRPALQEELIMALPMRPLCRETCRGLCPRCGADLNNGQCDCQQKQGHPKFAVLKKLKPQSRVTKQDQYKP